MTIKQLHFHSTVILSNNNVIWVTERAGIWPVKHASIISKGSLLDGDPIKPVLAPQQGRPANKPKAVVTLTQMKAHFVGKDKTFKVTMYAQAKDHLILDPALTITLS